MVEMKNIVVKISNMFSGAHCQCQLSQEKNQ